MRQVNEDELNHVIAFAMREISPALLRQLSDGRQAVKDRARHAAAKVIAGKLRRWEILSSAPPPPPFRDRSSSVSGVPPVDA